MKSLTKNDIDRRFKDSNWQPDTIIEKLRKPYEYLDYKFDQKCTIVIPGHPLIDSRPRFLEKKDGTIGTYNPHKAQLMKVFKEIYNESTELQGICILGPMFVQLSIYSVIPKNYLKVLNENEMRLLEQERMAAVSKPDVDNGMKIHYDVAQDFEYQILLRDEHVVDSRTNKTFVKDPRDERVVIEIYYTDNLPRWYKMLLYNSNDYLRHTLSMKYKFINQISDKEWNKIFFKTIIEFIKRTGKNPNKAVKSVLNYYRKKDLDLLVEENNSDLAKDKILTIVEACYIKIKTEQKIQRSKAK